ncbi:MAG: hypothetical protein ACD_34C00283G0001 [uncultured bacterium]|nr:MAG: hypothetical protein ACD_34C00283G0001 [uncultured bacterium]
MEYKHRQDHNRLNAPIRIVNRGIIQQEAAHPDHEGGSEVSQKEIHPDSAAGIFEHDQSNHQGCNITE